jgi:hypothetical protein
MGTDPKIIAWMKTSTVTPDVVVEIAKGLHGDGHVISVETLDAAIRKAFPTEFEC